MGGGRGDTESKVGGVAAPYPGHVGVEDGESLISMGIAVRVEDSELGSRVW